MLFLVTKKAQHVLGFLEKFLKNILAYRYRFKSFEILPNTKTASGSCSLKVTKLDICLFLFHGFIGSNAFGSGGGAGIPSPPTPFPSRAAGAAGIFCETPSGVSLKESSNLVVNILQNQTFCKFAKSLVLEPKAGIEPAFLLYESNVLPLNYFGEVIFCGHISGGTIL